MSERTAVGIHGPRRTLGERTQQAEGIVMSRNSEFDAGLSRKPENPLNPAPSPSERGHIRARGYLDSDENGQVPSDQRAVRAPATRDPQRPGVARVPTVDTRPEYDKLKVKHVAKASNIGGATSTIRTRVFGRTDNPPAAPGRPPSRAPKTLVD
jgi:hypothetical protein